MLTLSVSQFGCGHHKKDKNIPPGVAVGNLVVVLPDVSQEKQDLIIEAVEIHLTEFEKDFGSQSAFSVATVTTESLITCVNPCPDAIGCFTLPDKNIEVVSGQKFEVPAMYHELWHLNTPGGDLNHEHPDWPTRDARGNQIAADIRTSRPFVTLGQDIAPSLALDAN